jgi:two-component system, sensor histidine kinase and response regulator
MNPAEKPIHETILVVDDQPTSIHSLANMLRNEYAVQVATGGEMALEIANGPIQPDLILLDVEMPEMDGYEVCRRLKAEEKTASIPVIFVTARDSTDDEEVGLALGAVDYITKPFHPAISRRRIQLHLRLLRQQREIERQRAQLQTSLEELRAVEAMRDQLVHMMIHDLRSPLTGILGYAELLELELEDGSKPQANAYLAEIQSTGNSLSEMISTVLDVNRMEAREMPIRLAAVDVRGIVAKAIASLGALAKPGAVVFEPPAEAVTASCDPEITRRIVSNLVGNAVKFTARGHPVRIEIAPQEGEIVVRVIDKGVGIPKEFHQRIFEKFGQVETKQLGKKYSTGLGLAFCKLATEAQGGRIGVESEVGNGSTFWFTLGAAT